MAVVAEFIGFDYAQEDLLAEIRKNILTLLSTPMGSVPCEREFGLDTSYIDMPFELAQNELAVDIVEKVETYEPRAEVISVTGHSDADGNLTFSVLIGPNDNYTEEDEEADEEEDEEEEDEE